MIDIERYIAELIILLQQKFGERLLYVGLQGSYLRGEATADSDMDIMVIIDELSISDLDVYRKVIERLPNPDKSCGFICSKADLSGWNPLEIFHVLHSTKDYFGSLAVYIPGYTEQDIRNFVKLSLNNLYHEICHRYIHSAPEKNAAALPGTYKGVFFILQNMYALTHGQYIGTKAELLARLEGEDRAVLLRAMELGSGASFDFRESFTLLFMWCQNTLQSLR